MSFHKTTTQTQASTTTKDKSKDVRQQNTGGQTTKANLGTNQAGQKGTHSATDKSKMSK